MRRLALNVLLLLPATWLFSPPVNAATCESLAELSLPNTTINITQTVPAGAFVPPADSYGSRSRAADYKDVPESSPYIAASRRGWILHRAFHMSRSIAQAITLWILAKTDQHLSHEVL